ncbi:TetR/AcrR family transcriptional regulator [Microbacterium sp. RD1]|uniref:TetR/AcrR family transcriptional regulator n=1 Tax=Microbacterium sp. RD1 TaxID=3457313 RepID=UPI003FA5E013
MVPSESRAYRSDLRAQQAAQTRARILAAAADLFATQGYQATTMAAIARSAGVSTETVKAAASKAELLLAAFETSFSGTEAAGSLAETEAGAGLEDAPDAVFLDAVLGRIAEANARAHALWTVLLGAALSDQVVRAALDGMLARRHADFRMLVAELARRGLARASDDAVADELSFVLSPEGYQQLVAQSGWTYERYLAWLGERVRATVA